MKVLFILKKNQCYGFTTYTRRSSGLFNSTHFIVKALGQHKIKSHIIEVVDNNDIDREVAKYKPEIVVIEALWVVPEKFDVLKKLHPKVKWYVHLHSHIPFLALEGIAIEWIRGCAERGIKFIANSIPSYEALLTVLTHQEMIYLPNVYISHPRKAKLDHRIRNLINIGCFGAIRPLKNQLLQGMAALKFAREMKHFVAFHMNVTRLETGGDPILKNMRQLFGGSPDGVLIEHDWMEPEDFLDLLQDHIDLGMQVSLTETFNVVSADYVTAGIPIVVSKEVVWASRCNKAKDDSIDDIVKKMKFAWENKFLIRRNQKLLVKFAEHAISLWVKFARC